MTKSKRYRGRRRGVLARLLVVLVVLAAGVFWFRWQCWGVETTETQVERSGLPAGFDGLRLAHLSDLHGHEYGTDSAELLAMVAEQAPEIIVLTGDLIDRVEQLTMVPALAEGLSSIAPTYYVTGNH